MSHYQAHVSFVQNSILFAKEINFHMIKCLNLFLGLQQLTILLQQMYPQHKKLYLYRSKLYSQQYNNRYKLYSSRQYNPLQQILLKVLQQQLSNHKQPSSLSGISLDQKINSFRGIIELELWISDLGFDPVSSIEL